MPIDNRQIILERIAVALESIVDILKSQNDSNIFHIKTFGEDEAIDTVKRIF